MVFNTKSRSKKYEIIYENVRVLTETPRARIEIVTGLVRLHGSEPEMAIRF